MNWELPIDVILKTRFIHKYEYKFDSNYQIYIDNILQSEGEGFDEIDASVNNTEKINGINILLNKTYNVQYHLQQIHNQLHGIKTEELRNIDDYTLNDKDILLELQLKNNRSYFKYTTTELQFQLRKLIYSAYLYQMLIYEYNIDDNHTIYEIISDENFDMGLIGPGSGILTFICEKLCSNFITPSAHSILHDTCGRFYTKYKVGNGYLYAFKYKTENKFIKYIRSISLIGQFSGLFTCIFQSKALISGAFITDKLF